MNIICPSEQLFQVVLSLDITFWQCCYLIERLRKYWPQHFTLFRKKTLNTNYVFFVPGILRIPGAIGPLFILPVETWILEAIDVLPWSTWHSWSTGGNTGNLAPKHKLRKMELGKKNPTKKVKNGRIFETFGRIFCISLAHQYIYIYIHFQEIRWCRMTYFQWNQNTVNFLLVSFKHNPPIHNFYV